MRATLAHVWSVREYRALGLVMVLAGMSVSSYLPLVTLFLVDELGASVSLAGLFTLTLLAAPVTAVYVGRWSDRGIDRAPLMAAVAIWLAAGRVAMALSPSFAAAVVAGLAFGAFAFVLNAQVFAALKDVFERKGEKREATIASTVRTGYALGWAVGPLVGTLLAGWFGYRLALGSTAVFLIAVLLPLRGLDVRGHHSRSDGAEGERPRRLGGAALWVFALVCVLALTGEMIRLAYLPILAVGELEIGLAVFGWLMSIAPVVELAAMPIAGVLADRFGLVRLLGAGMGLGALGFGVFATSTGAPALFAGQVLNACFIAAVLGLGVTHAQRLSPGGAGLASSVFFGAQAVAGVTGSLAGSAAVLVLGLPALFFLPAILCLAAGALLLASASARRAPEDGGHGR